MTLMSCLSSASALRSHARKWFRFALMSTSGSAPTRGCSSTRRATLWPRRVGVQSLSATTATSWSRSWDAPAKSPKCSTRAKAPPRNRGQAAIGWGIVDERERRVGLNETVFREVNEQIQDVARRFDVHPLDLICECGDPSCVTRIVVSSNEYEQVRADPSQFAMAPGHEDVTIETVIAREKTYHLVRKHSGEPATLAAERDPRSS